MFYNTSLGSNSNYSETQYFCTLINILESYCWVAPEAKKMVITCLLTRHDETDFSHSRGHSTASFMLTVENFNELVCQLLRKVNVLNKHHALVPHKLTARTLSKPSIHSLTSLWHNKKIILAIFKLYTVVSKDL